MRPHQIKQATPSGNQKKALGPEERKAADAFLKSPNLLESTNALIGQSGVVGEETNRLIMYLIFTSRKRHSPYIS